MLSFGNHAFSCHSAYDGNAMMDPGKSLKNDYLKEKYKSIKEGSQSNFQLLWSAHSEM